MSISSSTLMFGLSLLAIPITYCVNTATVFNGERGLLVAGVSALVGMCVLTYLVLGRKGVPPDPLFYVFSMLTFSSVVDLIIALENDGIIQGFMSEYLRNGEPYLKTAYGTMICYWDGIGHYAMYLMMLAAQAWGQSYREVGLYWAGSIGHSMIVLVFGSVVGKYGVRPSFLLNVPFMFIPFMGGAKFLRERKNQPISSEQAVSVQKCILKRPLDLFFVGYFLASIGVALIRGFSVLGAEQEPMKSYMALYEPYLSDPVAYPKIQMLVYLFHYLPFYAMAIYALVFSGCQWLPDWALIHAGAAIQAQIPHIGASLHYRTPYLLRVPMATDVRAIFWAINLVLLLIIPQIFAYRCVGWPQFFQRIRRDSLKIQKSE